MHNHGIGSGPTHSAYERAQLGGVLGHRQVTDAYLVALAAEHAERLATFDRGLSALHRDNVHLLEAARSSGRGVYLVRPRSWNAEMQRNSPNTIR